MSKENNALNVDGDSVNVPIINAVNNTLNNALNEMADASNNAQVDNVTDDAANDTCKIEEKEKDEKDEKDEGVSRLCVQFFERRSIWVVYCRREEITALKIRELLYEGSSKSEQVIDV